MTINVEWHGGVVVAEVSERTIDASNAVTFKADVLGAVTNTCDGLILDMKGVEFVDSAGLGAIVGAFKQWGARGPFTITGVSSGVERVFRLTRMDRVFQIRDNVHEALRDVVTA